MRADVNVVGSDGRSNRNRITVGVRTAGADTYQNVVDV